MHGFIGSVLSTWMLLLGILSVEGGEKKESAGVPEVLRFRMKNIDGKEVDLAAYRGKVVLVVNVASECGLTPQYAGLQKLHEKYADQGLVVLGFPCNDFGAQEPGTEEDIKKFCTRNYRVTFPLFAKVRVKGDQAAPLYRHLTSKATNPRHGGPVLWNFEKFLIGRDGTVAARFAPEVEPLDATIVEVIESALRKKS